MVNATPRPRRSRSRRYMRAPLMLAAAAALVLSACDTPAPQMSAASLSECRVAVLGDSLTVGAERYVRPAMEAKGCSVAWIDAKGGRKTGEGADILAARAARGDVPSVLIVGLGTNDRYELDQLPARVDRIMALANGRHVIWVDNAYKPIRDRVNAVLADRARRYPNLTLMSWNAPYWSNPGWRHPDQVHATPAGYQARASLMADTASIVVK